MFKKNKSKTSGDTTHQKRLTEEDLEYGDHIFVRRRGLLYSHHGIYAGEGTVIHFKGEDKEKKDPAVILTEIDKFLCGGKLRKRHYKRCLPKDDALRNAKDHLSKKGYSLAFNNCEHFATYCATGKKKSIQVRRVLGSVSGIAVAVAGAVIQKKLQRKKKI